MFSFPMNKKWIFLLFLTVILNAEFILHAREQRLKTELYVGIYLK